MIDYFNKQVAKEEDNLETCDMEIEQDGVVDVKITNECPESPSLVDLEVQKQSLLEELKDEKLPLEAEKSTPTEIEMSSELQKEEAEVIEEKIDLSLEASNQNVISSGEESKMSLEVDDLKTNTVEMSTSVKTTCFGTPVLKSTSPYLRLPNPHNFSKDVSPVINFENLPNSTGKYEQMTDVLQKVRTTLKNLQNCNT